MNCREAKTLIKKGRVDLAADHTAKCPDCRSFAEEFGEITVFLEQFPDSTGPSADLVRRTLSLAREELPASNRLPQQRGSESMRTVFAAALAALFAPVLLLLNYWVATTGQTLLAKWLPPEVGTAFFVMYALGTVLSMSMAYGSLPLLVAAARDALQTRPTGGGLTA